MAKKGRSNGKMRKRGGVMGIWVNPDGGESGISSGAKNEYGLIHRVAKWLWVNPDGGEIGEINV